MRIIKNIRMLLMIVLVTLGVYSNSFAQIGKVYNIENYGAIGDGKTMNTEVIQNVIDMASKDGGGQVIIPEGRFLTGTVEMKSNVELYLQKNGVLLGSTNPFHYRSPDMKGRPETPKKDDNSQLALVIAYRADNISITGKGEIDGQGLDLAMSVDSLHHAGVVVDPRYWTRTNEKYRPKLIRFSCCKNVSLTQATFKNSSCWGISIELCERLVLDEITVRMRAYWNNDGMDITDCRNVRITNCDVSSADDGICLKSYYPGYSNDSVYIADCTVRSGASAIKFGTASYGGFKNITIENIKVYDTYRSAIAIESVDGGVIENIKVSGIDAKNTGNAIFIRLGHRAGNTPGSVKNVNISDMRVKIPFGRPDINYNLRAEEPAYHNPFPSSVTGIPGYYVENVVLENIEITYPGRASKGDGYFSLSRLGKLPEKIKNYPEFSMFGELPAWGFYVRHVKGIDMKNISLRLDDTDFRPAFVFDDVDGLDMEKIKLPRDKRNGQIILRDVTGFRMYPSQENLVEVVK